MTSQPSPRAPRSHRRSRRKLVLGATAVSAAVVGGTVVALAGGASAATVAATYSTTSSWDDGYTGQYEITNATGSAVNGWTLSFDLPSGRHITSLWNATYTASGQHITVTAANWNSTLGPDQSAVVGFVVAGGGASTPTGCAVNGAPCSVGSAPTPSGQPTSAAPSPTPTPTPAPPTPTPTASASASTPPPGSSNAAGFSPYVDTSLYPAYDLLANAKATGTKDFNLAFITNGGGTCNPEWGGVSPLTTDGVPGQIAQLRAQGGDVRVSFGGANGTELAESCTDAASLAAAYQKVISAYNLTKVDFDIEGGATADSAGITRRDQAIAQLQRSAKAAGKTLEVSFTLPVLPSGLVQTGINILNDAKQNGVAVSAVNVMAMDYGDGAAPNPSGRMGQYAIDAATATEAQVKSVFGWDDATAWKHVAVTPMIGVNDTSTEVFTVADAQQLATFAAGKHLAWLAMWSATRDQQCAGGAQSWASATCSSITQAPYAFSKAFAAYTG